ncbi:MAG: NACHT domain-containing protein, partial [Cyanobacteria bacterium P01_C01_bin.69]
VDESTVIIGNHNTIEGPRYYTTNVFGLIDIESTVSAPSRTLSRQEYRWRQVLVQKVKHHWIEGVLERSLHNQVLIELGLEEREQAVVSPVSGFEEFAKEAKRPFPKGTQATDVFDGLGAGRTLLILGEPGSGKTTTLLRLVKTLIHRIDNDLGQPIPVILNLSSWTKENSLAEWLVQNLYISYQVSKDLGEAWIEEEQLILCLDGLDEVAIQHRNECLCELNQFLQNHGRTEVIVCSRIRDYEEMNERLRVRCAVYIRPLTRAQVDQFLAQAGEQLDALKNVLHEDEELQNLATSPLLLSIMSLAYRNSAAEDILQGVVQVNYRKHLFAQYVDRMFQRHGNSQLYQRQQAQRWLIWLAKYNSEKVFLIEQLQPNSLSGFWQKTFYRLLASLIVGPLEFYLPQFLLSALFITTLLFVVQSQGLQGEEVHELLDTLVRLKFIPASMLVAIFIATASKLFSSSSKSRINLVENISLSWKQAGLHFVNALGSIVTTLTNDAKGGCLALVYSFALFPFLIPVCFVYIFLSSLHKGFSVSGLDEKTVVNQGFWCSLKNSVFGILIGIIFGEVLIYMVNVLFSWWFPLQTIFPTEFDFKFLFTSPMPDQFSYLSYIILFSIAGWSAYGGRACIQHIILRALLIESKSIPVNYAAFLDRATQQLFLQRVGGGYIFIHKMLMEHFAALPLE